MTDKPVRRCLLDEHGRWVGDATAEHIAAADAAPDGIIVLDTEQNVVPGIDLGETWVIPPLRKARVQSGEDATRYDALAHRLRLALVACMRRDWPRLAGKLETADDIREGAGERVAWAVYDKGGDGNSRLGAAMTALPRVWEGSLDEDELVELLADIEPLAETCKDLDRR